MSRLCRVLQVSRSGYCQWRVRPPSARGQRRAAFDDEIARLHAQSRGTYGCPRLVKALAARGIKASAERVRRSLVHQGLRPVYRRAWRATTDSSHRLPVAQNVLASRFDAWASNQAWVADITYLPTGEGWLYLAAILDLGSRRVVGWSMSERIDATLVCNALRCQYETRAQARLDVVDWIEGFCNRERIHLSIGYRTPCDYEAMQKAA